MDQEEELKALVKRKLRITFDDPETDARVDDTIGDARAELRFALGVPDGADPFGEPGQERSLLRSYCFYEWNDALDEFWANYAAAIARCREKWVVMQFAEENPQADELQ